jgi:hypothetical protein
MVVQRRFPIRRFFKRIVFGAIVVAALMLANSQITFAATPQVVGVAPAGQNSLEYVGRIDQTALSFNGYGYLTAISGIPDALVFTDPINHSEATARFTFVSTATLTARSVLDTLFVLSATGTTTIYYNEKPQASFKDPQSFAKGTVIATATERWQNVINVQSPDTGIATGIAEYTQTAANPFSLNGQDYALGQPKQFLRFWYTGEGKRTDKVAPNSTIIIAGYATTGSN